jgi:hypothetical protein
MHLIGPGTLRRSARLYWFLEHGEMNSPDHDVLFRAVLDARRVLGKDEEGSRTLERLRAVLNKDELVHALDRMNHRPVARLTRSQSQPDFPERPETAVTAI